MQKAFHVGSVSLMVLAVLAEMRTAQAVVKRPPWLTPALVNAGDPRESTFLQKIKIETITSARSKGISVFL